MTSIRLTNAAGKSVRIREWRDDRVAFASRYLSDKDMRAFRRVAKGLATFDLNSDELTEGFRKLLDRFSGPSMQLLIGRWADGKIKTQD